jgi:hypothetical protein
MPAPNVLDAMNQLATVFGAINGASPYTHSVQTVELLGRIWELVDDTERPYIGIQLVSGRQEYFPARQIFQFLDVRLVCHLPMTEDFDSRLTSQQELLDDLFTAINAGPGGLTLNQNVIDSRIDHWEVDASDPLAVNTIYVFLVLKIRRGPGPS